MIAAEIDTRLSKNHRMIYELVVAQECGRHLSMSDLYELARLRRPGIGFTTVYRAIVRLRDAGIVTEIALPGAPSAVYEVTREPHSHFRCSTCGAIRDVAYAISPAVASDLALEIGGEVHGALVSLHGRCADCITKSN